jgi:hypothetical protein
MTTKLKVEEALRAVGMYLQDNGVKLLVNIETCSFTHAAIYTNGFEITCHGGAMVGVGKEEFDTHDPDSFPKILALIKHNQ